MHTIGDHLQWRRKLSDSLARFFTSDEAAELGIHLGDLRDGCAHAIELIDRLAEMDVDPRSESLRVTLAHLKGELVDHLLPHIEELAPSITATVSRLYVEAEEMRRA